MKFTNEQIKRWKAYEKVRASGRYSMFDPRARRAALLSEEEFTFVIKNYSALKAAASEKECAHA